MSLHNNPPNLTEVRLCDSVQSYCKTIKYFNAGLTNSIPFVFYSILLTVEKSNLNKSLGVTNKTKLERIVIYYNIYNSSGLIKDFVSVGPFTGET